MMKRDMADNMIEQTSVDSLGGGQPLSGVAVAEVITNIDPTSQGRVKLRLPWMPGVEPWGRVAMPSGGKNRGIYFIPQSGDEVLVAFHHGDVREVYVLGSLWSKAKEPPVTSNNDPVERRLIRTPAGHEIEFDDKEKSIVVKSVDGHKITMKPEGLELTTKGGEAKVGLEKTGKITMQANLSIELKAQKITLDATTLELKGSGTAKLSGSGTCEIQGGMVKIN